MPNSKSYQDNTYYSRSQCAQQNSQQFLPYPIVPNNSQGPYMLDLMYSNKTQYPQGTPNIYEHTDNWLPDPRLVSDIEKGLKFTDKIETIEISSKDLSPASCCSNLDLLLPDFYKNSNPQWFYNYNKNYVEYPSCSQLNSEQNCTEKTVKYCSIQKSNSAGFDYNQFLQPYEKNDCTLYNQTNSVEIIPDVFPPQEILQFDSVPSLGHQIDDSNDSDIVVEESEEDITDYSEDLEKKFSCIICNVVYSPVGNQFYFLTLENPVTMTSQKSVFLKLKSLVGDVAIKNNYLCSQCLALINTIDHLERKLEECKGNLIEKFQNTNVVKVKIKKNKCNHQFNCKICKKLFSLKKVYRSHLFKHKIQNRFLCEFCGKHFTKFRNFKLHLRSHQNGNDKIKRVKIDAFLCKVCAKPFRTRTNLKEHENYCSGKLPYKCRICSKKFTTSNKLKNHIKLKHEKKFTSICSICNIGFIRMSDYKTHMISHSTDKKFSCTKCDKSYKTLSNLKFHMKFHEKKLPFLCNICSKGFMRKEYLESHMSSHTGEKNFSCTLCDKKFVSQKNLDAHFKNHDGSIKKKSCNICGKLISKGLEDHLRTHTNLKEFECDKCDMRFNTKSALLKHKKRKHEIKEN